MTTEAFIHERNRLEELARVHMKAVEARAILGKVRSNMYANDWENARYDVQLVAINGLLTGIDSAINRGGVGNLETQQLMHRAENAVLLAEDLLSDQLSRIAAVAGFIRDAKLPIAIADAVTNPTLMKAVQTAAQTAECGGLASDR